jgi:phosphoribosylformylglycinamidine cyclo-ligase
LGVEALIPTRSYVDLVEALLDAEVDIHAIAPGTGSGVSKVAFDHRPYQYVITNWVKDIPPLFLFMRELGVPLLDCLTTFNWGIGYYIFVSKPDVNKVIDIGKEEGYELMEVGHVEDGKRGVWFDPEGIALPPPGE